jgi:hypothetical protein
VLALGTILVARAQAARAVRGVDGWPFACYPLFNGIQGPTHPRLAIELVTAGGVRRVEAHDFKSRFGYRWHQMLARIVGQPEPVRARHLALFWDAFTRDVPELRDVREVRFLRVEHWLAPERVHDPPAATEVVHTWRPPGGPR